MNEPALLTEHEQGLYEVECGESAGLFGDRNLLIETVGPFFERLSWPLVVDKIFPVFPAVVRRRIHSSSWINRLQRAAYRILPRMGGAYRYDRLIERVPDEEFLRFSSDLLGALDKLGVGSATDAYIKGWIEKHGGKFLAKIRSNPASARTVLFITSRTDYKPLREAIALQPNGWRCFLIHLEPLPDLVRPLFESALEGILSIPFAPRLLERLLSEMHVDVVHVHCAMWHYHLGRIAIDNKGAAICACEFNDITSFYADRKVMSDYWSPELIDRDWAMERYICNKADILIHQWNPGMEAHWRKTHGGAVPTIEMQPYPNEQWVQYASDRPSLHDNLVRLVWAGQIPGRIACPPEVFDAYYLGEAIEKLLEQGFSVDAYQNPMFTPNLGDLNFEFYRNLGDRFSGRFAIKPGVRLDKLPATLGTYDYGLCLFDIPFHRACALPEKNKFMLTNKLSTYFEAGIPIILNWEYECMADFVVENGLGIALRIDEMDHVMEHIKRFDRDAAVERIKRYNRDHSMQKEIARLIVAYDSSISRRVS